MPKRLSLLLAMLLAVLALPATAGALGRPIPGQYIVVLAGGASGRQVAAEHARSAHAQILHTYDAAIHGYAAKLSASGLEKVKSDQRVAYVTQDVQGNPFDSQTLPTGIDRIDAETDSQFSAAAGTTTAGNQANVAVFDTGIDVRHPDLTVAGGVDCLDSTDVYNDGTYNDSYGHGTHVAGIIGAKNDSNGVVGVVPGVRLWAVRVGDSIGSASKSSQLCGINWITQNGPALGIKVVNSSQALFGSSDDGNCGYSNGDVLHQAICASTAAGVNWVFAASNGPAQDFINVAGAGYPQVLTVTGMADSNGQPNVGSTKTFTCGSALPMGNKKWSETDDTYYTSSKYAVSAAEQAHTIAAPAVCIWSTFKGQSYGYLSGTSMAAPHAAGVEELCILAGKCTGTTAQNIQQLRSDAAAFNVGSPLFGFKGDPLRPSTGRYYGYLVRAGQY
jgi:subtilisin family serine protease